MYAAPDGLYRENEVGRHLRQSAGKTYYDILYLITSERYQLRWYSFNFYYGLVFCGVVIVRDL